MIDCVLDASAILADLHGEPGGEMVGASIQGSAISAVNSAEVIAKLIEEGITADRRKTIASNRL